jgi:putative membrane protein
MLFFFFKWIHIIAVISWMAGVLYGYRLLVNLVETKDSADNQELLGRMAHKLYRFITMPALGVSWLAGFAMVFALPSIASGKWFLTKLVFVIFLTLATVHAKKLLVKIETSTTNLPSSKKLRLLNEVPTILMIIIVGLVVFKPF